MEGTNRRALFTQKGKLIYSINYGSEINLPIDIRKIVKSTYYDYNIISAIEVNQNKKIVWVVKLAGFKKTISVRVENGEMEEIENIHEL